MAFRDDAEAARARSDALEKRLAEVEQENARLKTERREATEPGAASPRAGVLRRPGFWLLVMVAFLGLGGVIEHYGGRPPWDALFPVVGAGSLASVAIAIVMALLGLRSQAAPTELLVVSGRRHRLPSGEVVGYRVVRPGQVVLRIPFLERLDRLDLRGIPLELEVRRAVTADGSVTLRASATVAFLSWPGGVERAIERFLGRPSEDVATVARQTIEGAVRAVLAQVATADLERERGRLADRIRTTAEGDFEKMGLVLRALALGTMERST